MSALSPGTMLSLVRAAREEPDVAPTVLVRGVMADELVRALVAGGEPGAVGRHLDPSSTAVVVVVVGGTATPADEDVLRAATRARVPVLAVQLDASSLEDIPYVRATDVVVCPAGQGFPMEEIAQAIARRVGVDRSKLGERLPLLRPPLTRQLIGRTVLRSAAIGALPWFPDAHFPLLALEQVRMSRAIVGSRGEASQLPLPPELPLVIGAGLCARSVARRLIGRAHLPKRLVQAGVATVGTGVIGIVALRRPL